jgi:formylglycine-generating enzyme required for sulfatase activity
MADGIAAGDRKLRVFISYSRKDEDFAQELLAGLEMAGFEPYLDKHDIAAGEDWETRLGRLIEAADTVVYVISPDAVASKRCAWEVERTVTLKKRLLPVVWRRVDEPQVPLRLKQLNYIFFDKPLMSVPSLTALSTALRTDLGWIREHTRIGEAALRWDGHGRNEALLFRGEELAAAKTWLGSPPQFAPEPTLLHHEFIKAGEDAEAARTSAERQRLDQMATALEREKVAIRRGQRALAAVAILFVCLIGVASLSYAGVLDRSYLNIQARKFRDIFMPTVLTVEQERALKPGDRFQECASCPEMMVIPVGEFKMGSDEGEDEKPVHKVTIAKPFSIGRFSVTFDEWDGCIAHGGCTYRPGDNSWGRGRRPVINVSWDDLKEYVAWLSRQTGKNYRLLTEAEWEYAARAGTTTRYPWGKDIGKGNANCDGCGSQWDNKQTAPVGSLKPNAFNLYEMHGNVWQWVEDCNHETYQDAPTDGSAWTENCKGESRILRGGSWGNAPGNLRSTVRYGYSTDLRSNDLGFRIGRTLTP